MHKHISNPFLNMNLISSLAFATTSCTYFLVLFFLAPLLFLCGAYFLVLLLLAPLLFLRGAYFLVLFLPAPYSENTTVPSRNNTSTAPDSSVRSTFTPASSSLSNVSPCGCPYWFVRTIKMIQS